MFVSPINLYSNKTNFKGVNPKSKEALRKNGFNNSEIQLMEMSKLDFYPLNKKMGNGVAWAYDPKKHKVIILDNKNDTLKLASKTIN